MSQQSAGGRQRYTLDSSSLHHPHTPAHTHKHTQIWCFVLSHSDVLSTFAALSAFLCLYRFFNVSSVGKPTGSFVPGTLTKMLPCLLTWCHTHTPLASRGTLDICF